MHWMIVVLLVIQYAIGFTMPEVRRGTIPDALIKLHLSFGAVILLLALVRLIWRLSYGAPPPAAGLAPWQRIASSSVHYLLYALIILVPILGWANASYRGWKVTIFSVIPLPGLVPARDAVPSSAIPWGWTATCTFG
jgi:cytochrome b561